LLALNIEILILKSKNSVKMRLRMLVFYAVTSVFCALCLSTETFLFASVLNALSACMAEDYWCLCNWYIYNLYNYIMINVFFKMCVDILPDQRQKNVYEWFVLSVMNAAEIWHISSIISSVLMKVFILFYLKTAAAWRNFNYLKNTSRSSKFWAKALSQEEVVFFM
jgi:hypothetical protein